MNDFPPDAKPLNTPWTGDGVRTPTEVSDSVVRFLGRTLPPLGTIEAGAEGGAAIGALGGPAAPVTVPLGALLGGGAASVLAKHYPPEIGGNPEQSNTSAFLWGAIPSGLGKTLGALHAARAAGKLDEATTKLLDEYDARIAEASGKARKTIAEKLTPGPATAGDVSDLLRQIGAKPQAYVAPAGAVARREATFPLRDAVMGLITRMRRQFGEPLGQAYDALKGNQNTLPEQDAKSIADAAQGVKESLISPAPQAQGIIAKLKQFAPHENSEQVAMMETAAQAMPWKRGDLLPDGRRIVNVMPDGKLLVGDKDGFEEIEPPAKEKAGEPAKPKLPTLDEMRQLRQIVNQKLRTATGGDQHALLNLQQAIDDKLVEHLPDNWSELRQNYKSFSDQFKYQSINQLRGAADPTAVSKWLFGRPKLESFIREVVTNANPAEKKMLQEGFDNFVLSNMDFNQPGEKQFAELSKRLKPYLANGTLRDLFGADAANAITQRMYLPLHAEALVRQLKVPANAQLFDSNFAMAARQNPDLQSAAEEGLKAVIRSLPPQDQAAYLNMFRGGPKIDLPPEALPPPGVHPSEAMREVLSQKLARSTKNAASDKMVMARAGTYGAAGLMMGRMFALPFVASRILTVAGGAGNRALLKAATNSGASSTLIRMMSEHPGAAGKYMYQLLASIGSVVGQKNFPGNNQPVEGVTP